MTPEQLIKNTIIIKCKASNVANEQLIEQRIDVAINNFKRNNFVTVSKLIDDEVSLIKRISKKGKR